MREKRKMRTIQNLFAETEKKAKEEGKIPIVSLKEKHSKDDYLLIRARDLIKIAKLVKTNDAKYD